MEEQNKIGKREDVCPTKKGTLDLNIVREKIDAATAHDAAEKTGPEYWRSLEELAGTDAFQEALHREFPKGASEWLNSVSRRGFLKVMGASLGLAGMTEPSWNVLRDYGNLSSATVLFVLDEVLRRQPPPLGSYGLLAAFGPGFTAELSLMRWQ